MKRAPLKPGTSSLRSKRKPSHKALNKKLDDVWKALVKRRGFCERCGKVPGQLDAHHAVTRSNRRLRWDPRSGVALCSWTCHKGWAHGYSDEFWEWFHAHRPEDAAYTKRVRYETTHYSLGDKLDMLANLEAELELELAA